MEPAGNPARGSNGVAEAPDLAADRGEQASLVAGRGGDGVAVYGVAEPDHRVARRADAPDQRGQPVGNGVGPHAGDEREAAGLALRVESLAQACDLLGAHAGPDLASDGVDDRGEQGDVRAV